MKIETKFSNGDVVFYATIKDSYTSTPCTECAGKGRLKVEGKSYTVACRDCDGRGSFGKSEAAPDATRLTIGRVGVEICESPGLPGKSIFSNFGPQSKREESYMAVETGVGSGSVYPVEDLFHTEAEALDRARIKLYEWRQRKAEQDERERRDREMRAREYQDTEETDSVS